MTITKRAAGLITLADGSRIETIKLVEQIRRFRGRKSINEIVTLVGLRSSRYSWLQVRALCLNYEITTNNPDDPEYYRAAMLADRRAEEVTLDLADRDKRVAFAHNILTREIAQARAEANTAPAYKNGALDW